MPELGSRFTTNRLRSARYGLVLIGVMAVAVHGNDTTAPSADTVNGWVRDLGAERFAARENASRQLVAAGRPAVAAVAGVVEAKDIEVRQRALDVLVELGTSNDRETVRLAVDALRELESSEQTPVRAEATKALSQWARLAEPKMVKALREAGCWREAGCNIDFNRLGHVESVAWDCSKLKNSNLKFRDLAAFSHLDWWSIHNAKAPDLSVLDQLPQLRRLTICNANEFDPSQLRHLEGLPYVRILELFNVADGDLSCLPTIASLTSLTITGTKFTDRGLKNLPDFPSLSRLDLTQTGITNDSLARLARFGQVECLTLRDANVDDMGLFHVAKMPQLRFLYLENLSIKGKGIDHLSSLTNLQSLSVNHQEFSNDDVAHLSKIASLESLDLSYTNVDDAALVHISKLPRLRTLQLSWTRVTDQELSQIARLTNLQYLDLDATSVTDSGLKELKSLTKLQDLSASNTEISQTGVDELRKSIPKLRVAGFPGGAERPLAPEVDPFRK